MPRHLLSLLDWSGTEIFDALKLAHDLKRKPKLVLVQNYLKVAATR
jgi:ornithine carbamoyltransferase